MMMQAWGWLFVPDGRCVVLIDTEDWWPHLPGGTVNQHADGGDPVATLKREAVEQAQVSCVDPQYLGYMHDDEGAAHEGTDPCSRVRMAARVTQIGPAAPDPATGRMLLRLLAPAQQAVELFRWGKQAHLHATAAEWLAIERWGLRPAPGATVSEIPAAGVAW
ncbi:hypothetical protein AB0D49_13595 [Streptomyces sp. NPDC048290]|uniref:hypothetical protein n=1 Tax=Streptomyces sp. NPDC048290 TaxID=3155811 RepID=UPI00343DC9B9